MSRFGEPFQITKSEADVMLSNANAYRNLVKGMPVDAAEKIKVPVNFYRDITLSVWTKSLRPFCRVYKSLEKTIQSKSLDEVPVNSVLPPRECRLGGYCEAMNHEKLSPAGAGGVVCLKFNLEMDAGVRWAVLLLQGYGDDHKFVFFSLSFSCSATSEYRSGGLFTYGRHPVKVLWESLDERFEVAIRSAVRSYVAFRLGCDFIVDEVPLAVDVEKWERTRNRSLVEKARRRGVIGWDLGKNIETGPHMRRPHFGIRWKGTGRSRPELVPVRGCIVNGKKLRMPEGYEPVYE